MAVPGPGAAPGANGRRGHTTVRIPAGVLWFNSDELDVRFPSQFPFYSSGPRYHRVDINPATVRTSGFAPIHFNPHLHRSVVDDDDDDDDNNNNNNNNNDDDDDDDDNGYGDDDSDDDDDDDSNDDDHDVFDSDAWDRLAQDAQAVVELDTVYLDNALDEGDPDQGWEHGFAVHVVNRRHLFWASSLCLVTLLLACLLWSLEGGVVDMSAALGVPLSGSGRSEAAIFLSERLANIFTDWSESDVMDFPPPSGRPGPPPTGTQPGHAHSHSHAHVPRSPAPIDPSRYLQNLSQALYDLETNSVDLIEHLTKVYQLSYLMNLYSPVLQQDPQNAQAGTETGNALAKELDVDVPAGWNQSFFDSYEESRKSLCKSFFTTSLDRLAPDPKEARELMSSWLGEVEEYWWKEAWDLTWGAAMEDTGVAPSAAAQASLRTLLLCKESDEDATKAEGEGEGGDSSGNKYSSRSIKGTEPMALLHDRFLFQWENAIGLEGEATKGSNGTDVLTHFLEVVEGLVAMDGLFATDRLLSGALAPARQDGGQEDHGWQKTWTMATIRVFRLCQSIWRGLRSYTFWIRNGGGGGGGGIGDIRPISERHATLDSVLRQLQTSFSYLQHGWLSWQPSPDLCFATSLTEGCAVHETADVLHRRLQQKRVRDEQLLQSIEDAAMADEWTPSWDEWAWRGRWFHVSDDGWVGRVANTADNDDTANTVEEMMEKIRAANQVELTAALQRFRAFHIWMSRMADDAEVLMNVFQAGVSSKGPAVLDALPALLLYAREILNGTILHEKRAKLGWDTLLTATAAEGAAPETNPGLIQVPHTEARQIVTLALRVVKQVKVAMIKLGSAKQDHEDKAWERMRVAEEAWSKWIVELNRREAEWLAELDRLGKEAKEKKR